VLDADTPLARSVEDGILTTNRGFDGAGRLAGVTDPNGNALAFTWGRSGVEAKETAAGQRTEYTRDADGCLTRAASRFADSKTADRAVAYACDRLDRIVSADYGGGQVETMTYDSWGRVTEASSCGSKAKFKYDYFGRVIEKREGGTVETYAYDAWGQRTERVTRTPSGTLTEKRNYDRYGRLVEIKTEKGAVRFAYNGKNQLARQNVNGTPVEYAYTPEGWLESKTLGDRAKPLSTLKYFYEQDGRIAGRSVDGKVQQYRYDARDQLVAVLGADNKLTEAYVYDPAGNILKKTVNGTVTEYVYDAANQLVSSVEDGILTTNYRYDAAGRIAEESGKTYKYGWLDKVLEVTLNGERKAAFSYHAGGQLATAEYKDKTETFLWDGLALIRRGGTDYLNEPHAGGGAPVLAGNDVLFNDQLGSTLGAKGADGFKPVARTAFGETEGSGADEFFTGKPNVADLGYAFLLRNYRPEHGKWQTADPLGYPDGWNNLAYVNNGVTGAVDWLGAIITTVTETIYEDVFLTGEWSPWEYVIKAANGDSVYGRTQPWWYERWYYNVNIVIEQSDYAGVASLTAHTVSFIVGSVVVMGTAGTTTVLTGAFFFLLDDSLQALITQYSITELAITPGTIPVATGIPPGDNNYGIFQQWMTIE
jgi:RHS repeat-associated protein